MASDIISRWPSPAKLNLFLHITGRRDDGYHNLQTVFQLLDFGDTLEIAARDATANGDITISGDVADIAPADNLIWRAATLLQQHSGGRQSAHIKLLKRIPMGAGLGGGSSNAATALLVLNQLWGCGLTLDQLASLGRQLGADVPVFVRGHSAWAEGIGEQLTPLTLGSQWFVVLKPDVHVKTAHLFSNPQLTRDCTPITIAGFRSGEFTCNVFEPVACHLWPDIAQALQALNACGSQRKMTARLTGTGACVFLPCGSKNEAQSVLSSLGRKWNGFIAQGVDRSPLHRMLDGIR